MIISDIDIRIDSFKQELDQFGEVFRKQLKEINETMKKCVRK